MSAKERERLKVLERVRNRELTLKQAAELTGVSYRQVKRQYRGYGLEGDGGLVHRGRGKEGNRGYEETVIARYKERYSDFGPTLASEKLIEDGYKLSAETLRQWLIADEIWQKRRKRKQHRSRRERRSLFGELLQMDGSHHLWFEGRREKCCLMNLVDDATGKTLTMFSEEETTEAAMVLLCKPSVIRREISTSLLYPPLRTHFTFPEELYGFHFPAGPARSQNPCRSLAHHPSLHS